jgi:hypothetical protein
MTRIALVVLACLLAAACTTAPSSDKVALPTAPRPGEPAGIAGLSPPDIRANFGEPAFVRKDGIAELWRYDGAGCKAFFFFYPEGGTTKVRHVETVPHNAGATAADPACLQLLLRRRATQPVS